MSVELGGAQQLRLDVTPAVTSLERLSLAADAAATSVRQGQAQMNAGYAEQARAATAYSDRLAAAQAEQRGATAALQSAREALRQYTEQQKALTAAQSKTNSTTAEYQRIQKLLEQNRVEIQKAKQAISENAQAVRDERTAVEQVKESRRQETNAARETAAVVKDLTNQVKQEAAAQREAASATAGTNSAATGLSGILGKVSGIFAGLAVVSFAKRIGAEVLEVTSDFQRMEAVLTTIFNGDDGKAQRVFAQLRQFTLKNPFEVREVTEGYVKLRNVGINPSIAQLQQLADLASASGKSFDTVTSGLLGATTGRFAQLKQFGITARQQGNEVALTFRGVTTVVEKSQSAISAYVLGLGALNGVAGATARIMETTGGKVTNLKDNFTELFNSLGEGSGGPVNAFIRGLTEITKGVNTFLKSRKQQVAEAAASPVQDYEDSIDVLFRAAVERAKKNGTSANDAVAAVVKSQQAKLAQQLIEAQKQVAFFTLDGSQAASLRQGNYKGGAGQFKADSIQAEAYLQFVKAGQKALQERAAAAINAGEQEEGIQGRILALRAKIESDTKQRDETLDTVGGNKERVRLNILLKQENELLAELEGREKKVRAARQYSYEAQLKALLAERATLTNLAEKAAIASANDAAEKAHAVFVEANRQVGIIKDTLSLRERELAAQAKKAGGSRAVEGLGEKADGRVSGIQEQQLNNLRFAAANTYADEIIKIAQEREQRLFDLRKDSNYKEIQSIDRHYSDLLAKAKDNIERNEVEQARFRAQEALRIQQEEKRIGQDRAAGDAAADIVGQTFGAGTGVSVYEAEQSAQALRLASEKKYLDESLALNQAKVGKEAKIEKDALSAQLLRVKHQQDTLAIEQKLSKFSLYHLILGDAEDEKTRAALDKVTNQVVSSLNQIFDAEQQSAANRAAIATQNISELTGQLAAQVALNESGSASNIKNLQEQINQERVLRKQALEEQRTSAKNKVLLDSLTQASSIATAAAELFAVLVPLGPLGIFAAIAGSALLVTSFVAAKASAYQAASQIGSSSGSYFVGGYTGDGNERDVSTAQGPRSYEYHHREFIMNHELTDQYRYSLFEPLHKKRPQDIDWSSAPMQALLPILPDFTLPAKMKAERIEAQRLEVQHSFTPLQAKFDALHSELAQIKQSNQSMADQPTATAVPGGVLLTHPNGNTKLILTSTP